MFQRCTACYSNTASALTLCTRVHHPLLGHWAVVNVVHYVRFFGEILRKESTKRKRNKPQRPLARFAQEQLPVGVQARSCIGAKTCVSRLHNDPEIFSFPGGRFHICPVCASATPIARSGAICERFGAHRLRERARSRDQRVQKKKSKIDKRSAIYENERAKCRKPCARTQT